MVIDSNFCALFHDLKLQDPWFPPRPWESIESESGIHSSRNSNSRSSEPIYTPSTVSEADLVRLVLNALQGVKSAVDDIEKLSTAFCSNPSDRTIHRVSSLWHRSSSTNAIGKILKSVGQSGVVLLFLRKFVDFFLHLDSTKGENSQEETGSSPPYSLINQAFAVAVGKILEEYFCVLNTLDSSVQQRHSLKQCDQLAQVSTSGGCLTSVVHTGISLLEVYLHTKGLLTQLEALGNICFFKIGEVLSSRDDFTAEISLRFRNFPRGADLLTYLYCQLKDADPVHRTLLKVLFLRSFEPYSGFIKSWIYRARIDDPYKEFIVECFENSAPYMGNAGYSTNVLLTSVKERNEVAVPCFLKDVSSPLLRAGQQLQVLVKMLDMCNYGIKDGLSNGKGTFAFPNLDAILPFWNESSSDHLSCLASLHFSKRNMEAVILKREKMYIHMQENLTHLLSRLNIPYWQISSSVIPFYGVTKHVKQDEDLISPFSATDKRASSLSAGSKGSDASSTSNDFSFETEELYSSECSCNSFEGQSDLEGENELQEIFEVAEPGDLCNSALVTCFQNQSTLQKPSVNRNWRPSYCTPGRTCEGTDSNSKTLLSVNQRWHSVSESLDEDHHSGHCWPLGGLLTNPFDIGYMGQTRLNSFGSSQNATRGNMEILKAEDLYLCKMFGCDNSDKNLGNIQLGSQNFEASPKNFQLNYNILSVNPMLTRKARLCMACNSGDPGSTDYLNSLIPFNDFTSVKDPFKTFGELLNTSLCHGLQTKVPMFAGSADPTARGVYKYLVDQHKDKGDTPVEVIDKSVLSSTNSKDNQLEESSATSVSGGSKWQSLLSYSCKNFKWSGEATHSSVDRFEMPIDVVAGHCIVQEILLQYKYLSSFTIKLLVEAFDLRGHLLALRRYHFMELADWADSFILSLSYHKKQHISEANQGISDIQGFLDRAMQQSSCQIDKYKERLFVYTKGVDKMSLAISGVHAFDFIALGYRVDWPISIILTPDALKIYAEIFSFLTQVKLAVFSLTDMWRSFKDLKHQAYGLDQREMKYFNMLIKMRQQVNHFVSTLQQYVQSQLSHISCRFLHSLKHQVKDMLDLQSRHMSYLEDSLLICFLSTETGPLATIIESILQCALDFRSCFAGDGYMDGSDGKGSSNLLSPMNFSKVFAVKASFEKNLKEFYLCYLKSPKHGDFGIYRFWECVNYNEYYSNIISRDNNVFPSMLT